MSGRRVSDRSAQIADAEVGSSSCPTLSDKCIACRTVAGSINSPNTPCDSSYKSTLPTCTWCALMLFMLIPIIAACVGSRFSVLRVFHVFQMETLQGPATRPAHLFALLSRDILVVGSSEVPSAKNYWTILSHRVFDVVLSVSSGPSKHCQLMSTRNDRVCHVAMNRKYSSMLYDNLRKFLLVVYRRLVFILTADLQT